MKLQSVNDPATDQNFREFKGLFPVRDLADDSVGPDQLSSGAKELFPQLASIGPVKIAFGTTELTWSASTLSAAKNVTHGLGVAPQVVVMTSNTAPAVDKVPLPNVTTRGETTFTCNAELDAAHTGTIKLDWIAIG